jgi:hypothetical protein
MAGPGPLPHLGSAAIKASTVPRPFRPGGSERTGRRPVLLLYVLAQNRDRRSSNRPRKVAADHMRRARRASQANPQAGRQEEAAGDQAYRLAPVMAVGIALKALNLCAGGWSRFSRGSMSPLGGIGAALLAPVPPLCHRGRHDQADRTALTWRVPSWWYLVPAELFGYRSG